MSGVYFIGKDDKGLAAGGELDMPRLLVHRPDIEIMRQNIPTSATVWVTPAEQPDTLEFFCVLDGSLSVLCDSGERRLGRGECFYVESQSRDVRLIAHEPTELLYITNGPMFDVIDTYRGDLNALMAQIGGKDNYTREHGKRVMHIAAMLYSELQLDKDVVYEDLMNAALFLDVGKCYTPDAVLADEKKYGQEENAIMRRHAADGANILLSVFGAGAARICRSHHERLDGSGYPDGLTDAEICPGSRLLAVADSFDAMITPRGYRPAKTAAEAAAELVSQCDRYDRRMAAALKLLVDEGKLPV